MPETHQGTTRVIGEWENFGGWKDFLENYVKLSEVSDLLNAPVGPLLIAKVSDPSGVTDIILKQKKRDEIKTDLKDVKQDLDDQRRAPQEHLGMAAAEKRRCRSTFHSTQARQLAGIARLHVRQTRQRRRI